MDKCQICKKYGSETCDLCINESKYELKKSEKRLDAERLIGEIKEFCGEGFVTDEYGRVVTLEGLLRKLDELVEEID